MKCQDAQRHSRTEMYTNVIIAIVVTGFLGYICYFKHLFSLITAPRRHHKLLEYNKAVSLSFY